MDTQALANQIAAQVLKDTQFWIALIGVIGAIIGSVVTILGNVLLHKYQASEGKRLDKDRSQILKLLLDHKDWRYLSTLSRVIGADDPTTRRLLVGLGARGSETPRDDGEEAWGLISKHPLDKIQA